MDSTPPPESPAAYKGRMKSLRVILITNFLSAAGVVFFLISKANAINKT
jgi:hypothetical protein